MKKYVEILNTSYYGNATLADPKYAIVKSKLTTQPSMWEYYVHGMRVTSTYGWALVEKHYTMSYYDSLSGHGSHVWVTHKWFDTVEAAQEYKESLETVY